MGLTKPSLGLDAIDRPLSTRTEKTVANTVNQLVDFQLDARRFPRALPLPRAAPIVALYAEGEMVGCATSRASTSGFDRLVRAFRASAAHLAQDGPSARPSVEVTYPRAARWLDDLASLELGVEGVALIREERAPTLLMPTVARDHGATTSLLLELLREKDVRIHGAASNSAGRLAAWTAARVPVHPRLEPTTPIDRDALAVAWLARMIESDGSVLFAIDARRRVAQRRGPFHHLRSALVIEALANAGGHRARVTRARRWLAHEIDRALAGHPVEAWPTSADEVAGTLALALNAGVVEARAPLVALANSGAVSRSPWHAAQVVLALSTSVPAPLFALVERHLDAQPFAPWLALAGHTRAAELLARRVRSSAPYAGAVAMTESPFEVPEVGLTALAAHALASSHPREATRALAWVESQALVPATLPANLAPDLALGAFVGSPIHDVLRGDIVAHAVLARQAIERARARR